MTTAYGLRADYDGTVEDESGTRPLYLGGLIRLDENRELDVRASLDAGGGVITVEDTDERAIAALDDYPPLKRLPARDATDHVVSPWTGLRADDLRAELERRGLDTTGRVATLVERLEAHDADLAAGNQTTTPNPEA